MFWWDGMAELLANIHKNLPELVRLLETSNSYGRYENFIYRFYCYSNRVYPLQRLTKDIVEALREIAPEGAKFCDLFEEIIQEGAGGKRFEMHHNDHWGSHTRVFVEAFFHARFFLEMAVKYGQKFDGPPPVQPYGFAALLQLYNLGCMDRQEQVRLYWSPSLYVYARERSGRGWERNVDAFASWRRFLGISPPGGSPGKDDGEDEV